MRRAQAANTAIVGLLLIGCGSLTPPPGSGADASGKDILPEGSDGSSPNEVDLAGPRYTQPEVVDQIGGVRVSTFAGSDVAGAVDGIGNAAQFANPAGIALDRASEQLIVAEYDGSRLRAIDLFGVTRTLRRELTLSGPFAIAVSSSDVLFIGTDFNRFGTKGSTSGTVWRISRTSGLATVAVEGLGRPRGLALLTNGKIAIADYLRHTVSTYDPNSGAVLLLAGSSGQKGFVDGQGAEARFDGIIGIAALSDGRLIVCDLNNHSLRQVTMDGTVSLFAGNGTAGMVDGQRLEARFDQPRAIAIDSANNVFVSDNGSGRVRRIDPSGLVQSVAGGNRFGFADGDGAEARFYAQEGIAVAGDGKSIFVADGNGGDGSNYHRIRRISVP